MLGLYPLAPVLTPVRLRARYLGRPLEDRRGSRSAAAAASGEREHDAGGRDPWQSDSRRRARAARTSESPRGPSSARSVPCSSATPTWDPAPVPPGTRPSRSGRRDSRPTPTAPRARGDDSRAACAARSRMRAIEEHLGRDRDQEDALRAPRRHRPRPAVRPRRRRAGERARARGDPPAPSPRGAHVRPAALAQVAPKEPRAAGRTVEEQLALVEARARRAQPHSVEASGASWCAASAAGAAPSASSRPWAPCTRVTSISCAGPPARTTACACAIVREPGAVQRPRRSRALPAGLRARGRAHARGGGLLHGVHRHPRAVLPRGRRRGAPRSRRSPPPSGSRASSARATSRASRRSSTASSTWSGPGARLLRREGLSEQCLVVEELARSPGGAPESCVLPDRAQLGRSRALLAQRAAPRARRARTRSSSPRARPCAVRLGPGPARRRALRGPCASPVEHPGVEVEYARSATRRAWAAEAPSGLMERAVALVAAQGGRRAPDRQHRAVGDVTDAVSVRAHAKVNPALRVLGAARRHTSTSSRPCSWRELADVVTLVRRARAASSPCARPGRAPRRTSSTVRTRCAARGADGALEVLGSSAGPRWNVDGARAAARAGLAGAGARRGEPSALAAPIALLGRPMGPRASALRDALRRGLARPRRGRFFLRRDARHGRAARPLRPRGRGCVALPHCVSAATQLGLCDARRRCHAGRVVPRDDRRRGERRGGNRRRRGSRSPRSRRGRAPRRAPASTTSRPARCARAAPALAAWRALREPARTRALLARRARSRLRPLRAADRRGGAARAAAPRRAAGARARRAVFGAVCRVAGIAADALAAAPLGGVSSRSWRATRERHSCRRRDRRDRRSRRERPRSPSLLGRRAVDSRRGGHRRGASARLALRRRAPRASRADARGAAASPTHRSRPASDGAAARASPARWLARSAGAARRSSTPDGSRRAAPRPCSDRARARRRLGSIHPPLVAVPRAARPRRARARPGMPFARRGERRGRAGAREGDRRGGGGGLHRGPARRRQGRLRAVDRRRGRAASSGDAVDRAARALLEASDGEDAEAFRRAYGRLALSAASNLDELDGAECAATGLDSLAATA